MSIQGIRDFFFSLRPACFGEPSQTSQPETARDIYEPATKPHPRHANPRLRTRWLERHRQTLEWVAGAAVLGTCAVVAGAIAAPVLLPVLLGACALVAVVKAVQAAGRGRENPLWVDDTPPSQTEARQRREWAAVMANPPRPTVPKAA